MDLAVLAAPPMDTSTTSSGAASGVAAGTTSLTVPIDRIAPNPHNTRDLTAQPEKIDALARSMQELGQLQDSAVVTREAYLRIFPEDEAGIGNVTYVQVMGARRRAASGKLGRPLGVDVRDDLAESRLKFLAATFAENIDREEYDPIEEARAVKLLVTECGSGEAAAAQLSRTGPWVTQRLNLLKLATEVQSAVRTREIPLRVVRSWHTFDPERQRTELRKWLNADRRRRAKEEEGATEQEPAQPRPARRSAFAAAVHKLGSPAKIAEALRSELPLEDRRMLAQELLREE